MARQLIGTAGWDHPIFMGGSNPNIAEYENHEESTYDGGGNGGGSDGGVDRITEQLVPKGESPLVLGNPSGGSTIIGDGYKPGGTEQSQSEIDSLAKANPAGPLPPKNPPIPGSLGNPSTANKFDPRGEVANSQKASAFGAANPGMTHGAAAPGNTGPAESTGVKNPYVQQDNPSSYKFQAGASSYDPSNPVVPKTRVGERPGSVISPQPGYLYFHGIGEQNPDQTQMGRTVDTMGLTSTPTYTAKQGYSDELVDGHGMPKKTAEPNSPGGKAILRNADAKNEAYTANLRAHHELEPVNTGVDENGKPIPEKEFNDTYRQGINEAINGTTTPPPQVPANKKARKVGGGIY